MDVISPGYCGVNSPKREMVIGVVNTGPAGAPRTAIRAFGTVTPDILALADWPAAYEVTHVTIESTGVSWTPIWDLLQYQFALLVNARHVKAVPGRKTAVAIAQLAQGCPHGGTQQGNVSGGAVPPARRTARHEVGVGCGRLYHPRHRPSSTQRR